MGIRNGGIAVTYVDRQAGTVGVYKLDTILN